MYGHLSDSKEKGYFLNFEITRGLYDIYTWHVLHPPVEFLLVAVTLGTQLHTLTDGLTKQTFTFLHDVSQAFLFATVTFNVPTFNNSTR